MGLNGMKYSNFKYAKILIMKVMLDSFQKLTLDVLNNCGCYTVTFLPEKMKIVRCESLVCNLKDNKPCVVNTRKLKQALNRNWVIEKVHGVIRFNQQV